MFILTKCVYTREAKSDLAIYGKPMTILKMSIPVILKKVLIFLIASTCLA